MKKLFIVFLVLFFSVQLLYSQNDKVIGAGSSKLPPKNKFDMSIFNERIVAQIEIIKAKIKANSFTASDMSSNAAMFQDWAKHPYIENATKIEKNWFAKLGVLMGQMAKIKTDIELSEERNLKERISKDNEEYSKMLSSLNQLLKNPPRIQQKNKDNS